MIQNTILNIYEPHKFKHQLEFYGIRQYDIARSIGVSQTTISRQLNGIEPMKEIVEDEIQIILNQLKRKRKHQPIPKIRA